MVYDGVGPWEIINPWGMLITMRQPAGKRTGVDRPQRQDIFPEQLELRTRFQFLLGNPAGFQFLRVQPKLLYTFTRRLNQPGWFIYNDFYFPFEKISRENHSRFNMFSTGLRRPLNPHTDPGLYYMLFSMKLIKGAPWRHIHQSCLAVDFNL
ncbi:MAG: hypothetical protein JRK26_06360 [Deltaproteobacteria bacterium]|nr:hypothetical protein [Deltaproteobacteria bacterium]